MTSDRVASDLMLPLREEVLWPFLDAWNSVRVSTHNLYTVERLKEVWAVRRALLPPFGDGANGPQGADSPGAQASSRMASFSSF